MYPKCMYGCLYVSMVMSFYSNECYVCMYVCMYVCKYVCMWLNWLECAVGDWQLPGPSGQSLRAGGPHT